MKPKKTFCTNNYNYIYNKKKGEIIFLNEKLHPILKLVGFYCNLSEEETILDEKSSVLYYLNTYKAYMVEGEILIYDLKLKKLEFEKATDFCLICSQLPKHQVETYLSSSNISISEQKEKKLYGIGSNVMCELGIDQDDVFMTETPVHLKNIKKNVKKVIVSSIHTFIIYTDNKVVSYGINDEGALGRPDNTPEDKPVEVNPPLLDDEYIVDGAASENATILLSNLGNAYIAGSFRSSKGRLGSYNLIKYEFVRITEFNRIKKVVAGKNHFVFLTGDGEVHLMGNNEFGQLGFSNTKYPQMRKKACHYEIPIQRDYDDFPVDIYCGLNSTFIKTLKGVLAFGRNTTNNIISKNIKLIETPIYLTNELFDNFDKIRGGDGTMFLLKEGQLYGRGNNQLHQINESKELILNKPISIHNNVTDFSVFANSTVMIIDGDIYTKGSNTKGELGYHQDTMPYMTKVTKIPFDFTNNGNDRVIEVHSGNEYVVVVTEKVK